eukprot:3522738-Karenia_brevis.AAC.1
MQESYFFLGYVLYQQVLVHESKFQEDPEGNFRPAVEPCILDRHRTDVANAWQNSYKIQPELEIT